MTIQCRSFVISLMHFSVGFAFDFRVGPTVATATVIALKVCNFHFEELSLEAFLNEYL